MCAVIFDIDGVLIDSEPLWEEAVRSILATVGVSLTPQEYDQTRGSRIDWFIAHWHRTYQWKSPSVEELTRQVILRVISLIHEKGAAKPGAVEAVRLVKQQGVPLAVASSSPFSVINANIEALGLQDTFDVVCSAEDEPLGKPHPGVYLTAASRLGVPPQECLVIEDSINGVLAAKAARMLCICVPDPMTMRDARLGIADVVLPSLADFEQTVWARISASGHLRAESSDSLHVQVDSLLYEIRAAIRQVDPDRAAQVQQAIIQSPRIFVAGKGRTGLHLQGFAMRLAQMGLCAYVVGETTTPSIEAGDLLLIGSASGQTASLVGYANRAREVDASVVVITGANFAPLVERAHLSLRIPAPSKLDQHTGALSAYPMGTLFEAALGVLLDTLLVRIMFDLHISADQMAARHANLE